MVMCTVTTDKDEGRFQLAFMTSHLGEVKYRRTRVSAFVCVGLNAFVYSVILDRV